MDDFSVLIAGKAGFGIKENFEKIIFFAPIWNKLVKD
jgi:hypothetical protein